VQPGQRIGKYVLGEKIAVGGMAEVWAARAEGPEGFVKPVALKFILESFSGDAELERLFFKEARIAAQLQHANLVAVFDFDKVVFDPQRDPGGRYYIAMEHVEGHDARRVVEAAKHAGYVFPMPLALYLVGEVCKGLRYVHERREHGRPLGLVHRDVSPHNVLVGFSGEVKLSDFGIAKSLAHSTRTKTGTIRGKLSYASPEQLNGEPVDHRADQFALGITLWEILAGRPLFDGNDEIEIVGKVMRCDVPALALVCPDRKFPAEVEAAVRRMLSPTRDGRFSSTADALSALLALPGYTPDGVGLGDLVRTLFHRSAGPVATMPLPDPRARPALGRPRAPVRGADPRGAAPANGRRGGPPGAGVESGVGTAALLPSEVETRTMARAPGGAVLTPRRLVPSGRRAALTTEPRRPAGRRMRGWVVAIVIAAAVAGVAVVTAVTYGRGTGPRASVAVSGPDPELPVERQASVPRSPAPAAAAPTPTPTRTPPPAPPIEKVAVAPAAAARPVGASFGDARSWPEPARAVHLPFHAAAVPEVTAAQPAVVTPRIPGPAPALPPAPAPASAAAGAREGVAVPPVAPPARSSANGSPIVE
jgi:hypothetical protein